MPVSYLAWDGVAVGMCDSPCKDDRSGGSTMARKPNYGFEKRKKEMDRKAKKDAKREERRLRREEAVPEESTVLPPQDDAPREG
jgi:hypothetical protein